MSFFITIFLVRIPYHACISFSIYTAFSTDLEEKISFFKKLIMSSSILSMLLENLFLQVFQLFCANGEALRTFTPLKIEKVPWISLLNPLLLNIILFSSSYWFLRSNTSFTLAIKMLIISKSTSDPYHGLDCFQILFVYYSTVSVKYLMNLTHSLSFNLMFVLEISQISSPLNSI